MSGAVKGKDVIMKRTCIEINEMMTDLMQQIENLNAKKVGLFCNLGKDFKKDFEINEELKVVDNELLQKHSTLFAMISSEKDYSEESLSYIRMSKKKYDEMITATPGVVKKFTQLMSDICLGNKHVSDIDKVDIECIPYYKKIVNLITMCVDPIYVDLEAENDN